MEKSFLRKVAGAKMLTLDPLRKHSFGHKNGIYALGWHVVGLDGKNTVEMARLLWGKGHSVVPRAVGESEDREAWCFGAQRTSVQILTLPPSGRDTLGSTPTLEAALLVGAQCQFWVPSHGAFKDRHSWVSQGEIAHSFEPSSLRYQSALGAGKWYVGWWRDLHIK